MLSMIGGDPQTGTLRWSRPLLIRGFVLGAIIERYMFISVARYEWEWLYRPAVAILLAMAVLGMLPTAFLFVVAYIRLENREPWRLVLTMASCIAAFVYVVFDWFLTIPWPATLLGKLIPAPKFIPTI